MRRRFGLLSLSLAAVLMASCAEALACTLLPVKDPKDATIKVFFTRFEKEDTSKGKYKRCRIVRTKEADTTGFFVTPFRNDATVVVHPSNWPE